MRRCFLSRIVVLIAWMLGAAPVAADVPRPDDIPDTLLLLQHALTAALPGVAVEIDDATLSLRLLPPNGAELTVFPDNLHVLLRDAATTTERQGLLDQWIESVSPYATTTEPEATRIDLAQVYPVLRNYDMLVLPVDARVSRPFPGGLVQTWVIDSADSITFIDRQVLADADIAEEELATAASGNLRRLAESATSEPFEAVTFLNLGGTWESSLMLQTELWQGLDARLGTIVAAIPARDVLIYADADQGESLAVLRELTQRLSANVAYRISTDIFRWTGTGWQVLPE